MRKEKSSELPFAIGIPALLWQVLFFYLPLLFIVGTSVILLAEDGSFAGLSFKSFGNFLTPVYARVIFFSLLLGISNTVICLVIGYPLAYFLAFTGKKFKNFLLFLLIVPFWTNFLLHVYAWFFVLEREGVVNTLLMRLGVIHEPIHFLNSVFSIMIMMVYYYLPFMVLPIYSSLERFDRRLIEASLDLGATSLETFRKIVLPLTLRGISAGFFLVYIPSFAEFAIPELMGGDKLMFVGNAISHYILGEGTGSLGASFTVISCTVLLLTAGGFYLLLNRLLTPKQRCDG